MARLSLIYHAVPLRNAYHLSFGILNHFDVFYVLLEEGEAFGVGEITPLPGYGRETPAGVGESVARACEWIRRGRDLRDSVSRLWNDAPFAASGIACAAETLHVKMGQLIHTPAPCHVRVVGLCGGGTTEEVGAAAKHLAEQGYGTFKMKVGGLTPMEDAARVKAAARFLPPDGRLRLDANQAYSLEQAYVFCEAVDGLEAIECLEQPFDRDAWAPHEDVASRVSVPLMLDESIWAPEDVRRAADCGASAVKFKLCKHPGLAGTREMVTEARRQGLHVVYGNGVQSVLGNHLEALAYCDASLQSAFEGNGFLKPDRSPVSHDLAVRKGTLIDGGLHGVREAVKEGKILFSTELSLEDVES